MKILILMLLLTLPVMAQNVFNLGTGILVSDTLKQTSPSSADTIDYVVLDYEYEWMNITVIDTGATFTDSLVVEYPSHNYTLKSGTTRRWQISDTTWNAVHLLLDSTGTNKNTMIKANGTASYRIDVRSYREVRIRMINVEVVANRSVWYKAQFSKK